MPKDSKRPRIKNWNPCNALNPWVLVTIQILLAGALDGFGVLPSILVTLFCSTARMSAVILWPMKRVKARKAGREGNQAGPCPTKTALRWAQRLAGQVEKVLARHPEADPEDVRLTLICLHQRLWRD